VRDAGKGLSVVFGFEGGVEFLIVGQQMLDLLDLVFDGLDFLDGIGLFDCGESILKL
jgi:hypothetical protein